MERGPSRPGGAAFHLLMSFLRPQQNRCRPKQLGEMRTLFSPFLYPVPPAPRHQRSHTEATSHFLPNFQSFSPHSALRPSSKGQCPGGEDTAKGKWKAMGLCCHPLFLLWCFKIFFRSGGCEMEVGLPRFLVSPIASKTSYRVGQPIPLQL